jgi:Bacterial cadherin-like domain
MFVPYKIKASAAAVALALTSASFTAQAVLERAGPVTSNRSVGFFPAWYQDRTGITLEFCAPTAPELADTWCLLGTGEVPLAPELFPDRFFDEHFYFAASAMMDTRTAGRALLVLAQEAAFATGAAAHGQQIVFSRIRVRLFDPAPVGGTYRFIHPYGVEEVTVAAGERIFFTEDIGIACPNGGFDCAITSRLGPFLLPSATPGGAEMPALTADNPTPDTNPVHFGGAFTPSPHPQNGKAYIADPARIGPVTGSPVGTNLFRIEGPPGAGLGIDPATGGVVDWIETSAFSLMGRLHDGPIPGRVAVQRASYARNAVDGIKVDVLADGQPTTASRMPGQAAAGKVAPALTFYNANCVATTDVNGVVHYSAPSGAGIVETPLIAMGNQHWGQVRPAALPESVCLKHANARDVNGQTVVTYAPHRVTDEVTISRADYDQIGKTLTVSAVSSDAVSPPTLTLNYPTFAGAALSGGVITLAAVEVPPHKVTVSSSANNNARGSGELDVTTPLYFGPPQINGDCPAVGTQDQAWTCSLTTTPGATLALTTFPAGMTLASGVLRWTPTNAQAQRPANQAIVNPVTVTATSSVGTVTKSVDVVVANVNDAPTATAKAYTSDTTKAGRVTVAAPGLFAGSADIDGDALAVGAITGAEAAGVVVNSDGLGGFVFTTTNIPAAGGNNRTVNLQYRLVDVPNLAIKGVGPALSSAVTNLTLTIRSNQRPTAVGNVAARTFGTQAAPNVVRFTAPASTYATPNLSTATYVTDSDGTVNPASMQISNATGSALGTSVAATCFTAGGNNLGTGYGRFDLVGGTMVFTPLRRSNTNGGATNVAIRCRGYFQILDDLNAQMTNRAEVNVWVRAD